MIDNSKGWYLTVGDLIERLQGYDPTLLVAVSGDAEGNSVRLATSGGNPDPGHYVLGDSDWELELEEDEETGEWVEEPHTVVVIWPVN